MSTEQQRQERLFATAKLPTHGSGRFTRTSNVRSVRFALVPQPRVETVCLLAPLPSHPLHALLACLLPLYARRCGLRSSQSDVKPVIGTTVWQLLKLLIRPVEHCSLSGCTSPAAVTDYRWSTTPCLICIEGGSAAGCRLSHPPSSLRCHQISGWANPPKVDECNRHSVAHAVVVVIRTALGFATHSPQPVCVCVCETQAQARRRANDHTLTLPKVSPLTATQLLHPHCSYPLLSLLTLTAFVPMPLLLYRSLSRRRSVQLRLG